jgi:Periplasmic binding protein domain
MMPRRKLTISIPRATFSDMGFRCGEVRSVDKARRTLSLVMVSACAVFLAFPIAARAEWPERAVKLLVTFPPGSANDAIPVASCSLSEPELEAIGDDAVDGHLSSSVYFCSIQSPENIRFLEAYESRYPEGPTASADAEASYNAVWLLARGAAAAKTDDPRAVKAEIVRLHLDAPQGKVWIDEQTFHAHLTPRIGRSNRNARFDLVSEARAPVQPDPYLVHNSSRFEATAAPILRLVA